MTHKPRKRNKSPDASPVISVARELRMLRRDLKEVGRQYLQRIEGELAEVLNAVNNLGKIENVPSSKIRDLRDMTILLRGLQIKAEKGRRKDLKKIDSIVGELRLFLDRW